MQSIALRTIIMSAGIVFGCCRVSAVSGPIHVSQHHNHASRDGLFIDPAFTKAAAAGLRRDTNFDGRVSGHVYAQPLYIEDGPGGKPMVIAVTESNNVYALDAANGGIVWQRHVGAPVSKASLPCGDIDPLGITGTPVVDLSSRTLFFDAMTTPDNGATKKHLIFAVNVDTGNVLTNWPVDVNATVRFNNTVFTSITQNQRSALGLVGDTVYVTYGGHAGDCGTYFGWIVGVSVTNPANVTAWATTARGGGSWGVGGVASDGVSPYIATGNTFGASVWGGGEAVIRFQPGLSFNAQSSNFWAPTNWISLDSSDADLGGSGPLLLDVPGANPSKLILALGKDGNAYLLDRTNLGGINRPIAQAHVSSTAIIQAAASYHTALGTYAVLTGGTSQNQLIALRIGATGPPTITNVWTKSQNGRGSPFVTSTDGTNSVIVWGIGAESDQRLHGFDGDTGAIVYAGGGPADVMAGTRRFSTAIAARGRIYAAGDDKIYAFTLPTSPIRITNLSAPPDGVQFGFTNSIGMSFTAFTSTNLALALTNWTRVGFVPEVSPGQFRFTVDPSTNGSPAFYRVRSR